MGKLIPRIGETGHVGVHRRSVLALTLLFFSATSLLSLIVIPHTSAAGETYDLTTSSSRVQEYVPAGITLFLNVAGATVGNTYEFNFTVVDPSGSPKTATNSTFAASSSFTTKVVYPRDFGAGASTKYVGNYTIDVQQNQPVLVVGVESGQFQVGLTESVTYERTYTVSTRAIGYTGETVTIRLLRDSTYVPSFPRTQQADAAGNINFPWQIPADAETGTYSIDLIGTSTSKSPADTQTFTVYPTNTSIPGLSVSSPTISRTLIQQFVFAPQYPSGQQVQTGQTTVRIAESDGVTYVYTNGTYDSQIGRFRATYKLPRDAMPGIWVATIDANMFDDGYGNGGPSLTVAAGFYVQPASLNISIASASQPSFGAGDVIPVYALVKYPDGTLLNSGTVTARLLRSGVAVGTPIVLSYISGQQQWAGSYQVGANDPSGIWLVIVDASDQNGNMGQGTSSAVVSIPPTAPPPPLTTGLNTSTFLLIAAAAAAGAIAALAWALLTNRRKFTKSQVKLDLRLVDREVGHIQDSEFFQSVKKQVEDEKASGSQESPHKRPREEDSSG